MASLSLLLLLLILCVSLHACTPRPLTIKDTAKYHFDKDLDNTKEHTLEENPGKAIIESGHHAGSYFPTDSPSLLAAKDERGHARSMLGHVEETMVTNANDSAEDIVDMDYAQPHRKPPIHNEKS